MNAKKVKALRKVAKKAFKTKKMVDMALKTWKNQYKKGEIQVPNHKTTISKSEG